MTNFSRANTFVSGTTISSSAVNANWTAAETFLNTTGVSKLQGAAVESLAAVNTAAGGVLKGVTADSRYCTGSLVLSDQRCEFYAIYVPDAGTLTGIKWMTTTQGAYTANNNGKIGLYSGDGTTLTQVAACANDSTLFSASSSNTTTTKAFATPYVAVPGWYYVAYLWCRSAQTTIPQIAYTVGVSANFAVGGSQGLSYALIGQTDLPASKTVATMTSVLSYTALFGVY